MQLYINVKSNSTTISWFYVMYDPISKQCYGGSDIKYLPLSLSYDWFDPYKCTYDLCIEFDNIDNLINTNPELFI